MARIQTPQEQLAQVMNTPGLTPGQVKAAEAWAEAETKRRKEFGLEFVKEQRARAKERTTIIEDGLYECAQSATDLYERTRKGELDSVQNGFKEAEDLRRRIEAYERSLEALEESEGVANAVAGDPAAYFHSFYERWETLAKNLPSITDVVGPLADVNKT
jgi:hypothetical protein